MYTLFIDTHDTTNIAIFYNDALLASKICDEGRQSTIIMPLLDELLKDCKLKIKDINRVLVVNGPGSFTGVRLGVVIAKTISYLLNIEIRVIDSLRLMAIMDDNKHSLYGIKDTKGMYLYDKKELKYLSKDELLDLDITTNVTMLFDKIINNVDKFKKTSPELVNPLYVKNIEVLKW